MVENNYLIQERSPHDRRSVRVKLSEKGLALHKKMGECFEKQVAALPGSNLTNEEISKSNELLKKLERFWGGLANYSGD